MPKKTLSLLLFVLLIFSCNKEDVEKSRMEHEEKSEFFEREVQMCYFSRSAKESTNVKTKNFIRKAVAPVADKIPRSEFVPWTEAIRISGVGFIDEEPCFIINKRGILFFNSSTESSPFSYAPSELFPMWSVTGFYNTDIGVLVRSFKTSLFEYVGDYAKETYDKDEHLPLLNRYNSFTQEVESLIFPHHFSLPAHASLTSLIYSGRWYASFKLDSGEKVEFRYFSFENIGDVLNARYEPISAELFMRCATPIAEKDPRFANLPQGLIDLLHNTKEENILIEYFDKNIPSPMKVLKDKGDANGFEEAEMQGYASSCKIEGKIYYSLLLENGKLYLSSTEDAGKLRIYFLPQLPNNFVYSYFAINQDVVLASWEEVAFYECGRSGFFIVPLSKLKQEGG